MCKPAPGCDVSSGQGRFREKGGSSWGGQGNTYLNDAFSTSPNESSTIPLSAPFRSLLFSSTPSSPPLPLPLNTISSSSLPTSSSPTSLSLLTQSRMGPSKSLTQPFTTWLRFAASRRSRGTSPAPRPVAVPRASWARLEAAWMAEVRSRWSFCRESRGLALIRSWV